MSQRFLNVLAAKPGGGSATYVNGVEREVEIEEMQKIVNLTYLAGKYRSPWCGRLDGYFFVKGFFENKDDCGNEMSFSYCTKTAKPDEAKSAFLNDIESLGYKLDSETKSCIEKNSHTSSNKIIGISIVVIALALILLKIIK